MSHNELLARRIREILDDLRGITEMKMFGGIAFMLNGNMLCGIIGDDFIARLDPDNYEIYLKRSHTRKFERSGRVMKGFILVSPKGYEDEIDLSFWVKTCVSYAAALPEA